MDAQLYPTAQINANNGAWTPERFELLKLLYESGASAASSAEQINESTGSQFTRNSIIGKWHRENFEKRQRPAGEPRVRTRRYAQASRRPIYDKPQRLYDLFVPRPAEDLAEKAKHIDFLGLESNHCRFPYGNGPFTFCGHDKMEGSSYCQGHFIVCTGLGTASERAAVRA